MLMALLVPTVAAEIGDVRVFARTLLHFVYLDIQEGRFARSKALMRSLLSYAAHSGDSGMKQATEVAWLHMRRVKALAHNPPPPAESDTTDPYYRQRLLCNAVMDAKR